jgi:hypothetical protein
MPASINTFERLPNFDWRQHRAQPGNQSADHRCDVEDVRFHPPLENGAAARAKRAEGFVSCLVRASASEDFLAAPTGRNRL